MNFKTKKIICLVIIFSMMFSLVACGKKSQAQGENLSVTAKGINTKKLVLKISGTFPEGTTPAVSYISDELIENMDSNNDMEGIELVPIINAVTKSIKENCVEYLITGLNEGFDEFRINFVKDNISYSRIVVGVSVDSSLKISKCTFNILEVQEQYILSGDIETDDLDSSVLSFSLKDENFDWTTKSADEEIITVSGPYYNKEDLTTNWKVSGKSEGIASLVLVNNEAHKQIDIEIESYRVGEGEDSALQVRVLSSGESEYSFSYSIDDVYEANTITNQEPMIDANGDSYMAEVKSERIENLKIADAFTIKDLVKYEDSKSNPVMELEMEDGDTVFFVKAWGNNNLKSVREEVTNATIRKTLQNYAFNDLNVEYYDAGVDIFLFEKDQVVYLISFVDKPNFDAHKTILDKYLYSIL